HTKLTRQRERGVKHPANTNQYHKTPLNRGRPPHPPPPSPLSCPPRPSGPPGAGARVPRSPTAATTTPPSTSSAWMTSASGHTRQARMKKPGVPPGSGGATMTVAVMTQRWRSGAHQALPPAIVVARAGQELPYRHTWKFEHREE